MGAQPDTITSTPEIWHGVQQTLAQASVAAHLATYLAILQRFVPQTNRALANFAAATCRLKRRLKPYYRGSARSGGGAVQTLGPLSELRSQYQTIKLDIGRYRRYISG